MPVAINIFRVLAIGLSPSCLNNLVLGAAEPRDFGFGFSVCLTPMKSIVAEATGLVNTLSV